MGDGEGEGQGRTNFVRTLLIGTVSQLLLYAVGFTYTGINRCEQVIMESVLIGFESKDEGFFFG